MSTIRVPIDATRVPELERGKQKVRVALRAGEVITSHVMSVTSGHGEAMFEVDTTNAVTIAVGPEASDAADLFMRNTPTVTVRPAVGDGGLVYNVQPIVIQRPIWEWWLIWCRKFTITGHVYGPDSNPVPGALVSASDVYWFWWWSSTTQVGTAVTDATGHFEIDFTWCCGWLPWYWWDLRPWRLDPILVDKINPVLEMTPGLRVSAPNPKLTLAFSEFNPQPDPPGRAAPRASRLARSTALNPSTLPALRDQLLASLPAVPEFERLRIWPWYPWAPWFDCDPSIVFKVTQTCGGVNQVILDETVWQAHWDIPTNFNVNLFAGANACTIVTGGGQPPTPCFGFTQACDSLVNDIGLAYDPANPADANPVAGLVDPLDDDRPFTGSVSFDGLLGVGLTPDYYGVQYRPAAFPNAAPFTPVPSDALQAFSVSYYDGTLAYPNNIQTVTFAPQAMTSNVGPVTAYQSLINYENVNPGPGWGSASGRAWLVPDFQLSVLLDSAKFMSLTGTGPSAAYEFQIVGYAYEAGVLTAQGALPPCPPANPQSVDDANDLTLFFDNPLPPAAGSTDPDGVQAIYFNGAQLQACGIQYLAPDTPFSFEVDFTASDVDGFLNDYSLVLYYGDNQSVTLIDPGAATEFPLGGAVSIGAGLQQGPSYADAMAPLPGGQGGTRPYWYGGAMSFTIDNAIAFPSNPATPSLFPEPCAYDLILTVTKRNIVDCDYDNPYQTYHLTFTVLQDPAP
jgi:hypothetical protein